MKLTAPKDTTSANVGGQEFTVGKDGCITVPDTGDYLSLLTPHGFVLKVEPVKEQNQNQNGGKK